MAMTSTSRPQSEAQIIASIGRRYDRLVQLARGMGEGANFSATILPAMLAQIAAQREATLAAARAEIAARPATRDGVPIDAAAAHALRRLGQPYWCAACAEPGTTPVCACCAGPAQSVPADMRRAA